MAPDLKLALTGAALTGIGYSLVYPGLGVEAIRRVPAQSRGLAMGAYTAFLDVALGFGTPALGLLASGAGLGAVFIVSVVAAIVSALIAGSFIARPRSPGPHAGDVYAACLKLREAIAQKVGFNSNDAAFADGQVRAGNRSITLAEAACEAGLSAEDMIEYGDLGKRFQKSTFVAHFIEVGVDGATGEVRVRRMLAVCSAGSILNPKAARSRIRRSCVALPTLGRKGNRHWY